MPARFMTENIDILVWVPSPLLDRVENILRKSNRTCAAASSFSDAIGILSSLKPRMLIALLDKHGLELLRTARTYSQKTKVILMEQ